MERLPGCIGEGRGKTVLALPGPKGEFEPMAAGPVRAIFEDFGLGVIVSRTLRVIGIGESSVAERLDR